MANVYGTDLGETINATDGVTNGADSIFGYGGADSIFGLGGNDEIKGGGGADALDGDSGSDTANYSDSAEGVVVNLVSGEGTGGTAEGDTLTSIENLTGSAHDDHLQGNGDNNVLSGLEDNDVLKGGGGADTLFGDSGNDTLKGGGGADTLNGGSGIDTADYSESGARVIVSLITDTASEGDAEGDELNSIENLNGSSYADTLWGHDGTNVLKGMDGNDSLKGYGGSDNLQGGNNNDTLDGGAGNDTMTGGTGSDIFIVDSAGDTVIEASFEGNDTVRASVNYQLAAGVWVETLRTTDDAAVTAINLTGNGVANSMFGNAGANTLDGKGNADTMTGGAGNDRFYVGDVGDQVNESAGQGSDTVIATTHYTLQAGTSVELLRTTGSSGTGNINLTGNELAQTLQGNAGINSLTGGVGADTMQGFAGDDSYFVDNTGDLVFETAGNGSDRIIVTTGIIYTMAAGVEVELLRTSGSAGVYAVNLHGNELANTIQGNNGANVLSGGLGNDTMQGFGAADIFRFNTALGIATNVDTIVDFNVADDTIQLADEIFAGLAVGTLDANAFHMGPAAADAEDRIIYNSTTGALIFDSNGSTSGGNPTQFATLTTGLALTAADFVVI